MQDSIIMDNQTKQPQSQLKQDFRPYDWESLYRPAEVDEDAIDFVELGKVLWQGKQIILRFVIAAFCLAVIVALITPPSYRAVILFAPAGDEQGQGRSLASRFTGLASLAGINLNGPASTVDSHIAILKSRKFTQRFIKENQVLPVLFPESWDVKANDWKKSVKPNPPSDWLAYQEFDKLRNVLMNGKSGLISLSISGEDPEITAKWANGLVETFNAHIREETISEAKKSINYLKQQIKQTRVVDMQEILYRLVEQQMQTITLAEVRDQFAFNVIDPAVVPEKKYAPNRLQIVMVGTMLGAALGIFLVFVLNFTKTRFPEFKSNLNIRTRLANIFPEKCKSLLKRRS